jgi:hypothetical protein
MPAAAAACSLLVRPAMRQAGWLGGVRGASNHGATARAGLHLRQLITPPSALLKNQVLLQSFSASSLHALAVGLERARRVQAEWACRTLQPPGHRADAPLSKAQPLRLALLCPLLPALQRANGHAAAAASPKDAPSGTLALMFLLRLMKNWNTSCSHESGTAAAGRGEGGRRWHSQRTAGGPPLGSRC